MMEANLTKIKEYYETMQPELERKLTILSLAVENLTQDPSILQLKQSYCINLINNLDSEVVNDDMLYYIDCSLTLWFNKSVEAVNRVASKRKKIHENMISLKRLKLPDQRSEEWYKIRENLLTASSLADALGKGHFQTRDDLLISKTQETKKSFSKASLDIMQWGVKYEPVATRFYEHLNDLTVVEFGLIPHPNLSVFGASPDGICDIGSPDGYEGRMLEIKCPPKRKFTKEVPHHYWMQMQGQLEVCDLEDCDFLQVKLEEYFDVSDYEKDCLIEDKIQHGYTKNNLPKGLILSYKIDDHIEYLYSPWLASLDQILNWQRQMIQEHSDKQVTSKWWKIERYECTLVRRDKEWWSSKVPDIMKFWADVVHYRKVGNEEVQKRIDGRKRGPRKKVFTIKEPLQGYQMDSDDD